MLWQIAFNSKIRLYPPHQNGVVLMGGYTVSIFSKLKKISTNRLRWVFLTMILGQEKIFVTRRIFYARRIFYTCQRIAQKWLFFTIWAINSNFISFCAIYRPRESQNLFTGSLEGVWKIQKKFQILNHF